MTVSGHHEYPPKNVANMVQYRPGEEKGLIVVIMVLVIMVVVIMVAVVENDIAIACKRQVIRLYLSGKE